MGGCVSSSCSSIATDDDSYSTSRKAAAAKLISLRGELREYSVPVTVSQVLLLQIESSSSSCFICNSDSLYYDEYIPAMNSEEELQPGQIYFLLPSTKLQHRLTASDMAALAVKASIALQNHSKKAGRGRNRKSRISPVSQESEGIKKSINEKVGPALRISRSASLRKLHRYSSRRARLAVRSFRLRLTTIYEGSVL